MKMKPLFFAIACLVAFAAIGGHATSDLRPATSGCGAASTYGICAHVTRSEFESRDENCRLIADTGIGAVRSDVDWHRCQPQKDAPFDFSRYDAVLASTEAAGLRLLPILMRPPRWATPIWEHLDEWGAFVEAFVRRYGDRCPDIEIMNEVNLVSFWGSEPDATLYAEVLKAAYAAAKRANPNVRVLLGGLCGVPIPFIRRLYECGSAPYFDVLCIHPYSHPYAPEGALDRQLDELRALMAEFGDEDKPVIITELGWPTHDSWVEGLPMLRMCLNAAHPEKTSWRVVYAATSPGPGGNPPHEVAVAIEEALPPGSSCEACFGERLRERLAAGDVDAVVYPFNETFPVDTFEEVVDFVKKGGTLVDFGGMPLWFPCEEVEPGRFIQGDKGEPVAHLRKRLRLDLDAFWLNKALPREGRAFPTDAAKTAGYKGDPAGERARRFQTPRNLAPGDEFIPLLTMPIEGQQADNSKEGAASGAANAPSPVVSSSGAASAPSLRNEAVAASLIRYGGADGLTGCLIVSGVMGRSRAATTTEDDQARFLTRSLAISLAKGVDGYYWYNFRAFEDDPTYSEHHFGITHANFAPKPALSAYFTFIRERPEGSEQSKAEWRDDAKHLFFPQWTRPDGVKAGVIWKPGATERMALRFDGDAIAFRSYTGRTVRPARDADGAYLLPIGEGPIFFEGGWLATNN